MAHHAGIVLAVHAEDRQYAEDLIANFANNRVDWSEWYSLGGTYMYGECNWRVLGDEELKEPILRRSDNPVLFDRMIARARDISANNKAHFVSQLGSLTVDEITSNPLFSSHLTPAEWKIADTARSVALRNLLSMHLDILTRYSTFYDVTEETHRLEFLRERCRLDSGNQWLALVDFGY